SVEVFDEHDLVVGLVVDELVDDLAGHQQPEPSRPKALLLPREGVAHGLVLRIAEGRVAEGFEAEALSGIRDAVEEHAARAQIGDANALGGIEAAAPLDGVHEELAEGLA